MVWPREAPNIHQRSKFHLPTFLTQNIYRCVGPIGASVREGICGSAIVYDDPDDAGVVGFFQSGDTGSDYAVCPCLDDLIDRGWAVV